MQHVLGGTLHLQTRRMMDTHNKEGQLPDTSEVSRDVKFEWTETPMPLKDIIETTESFPCVVKMWREKEDDSTKLDIHKPLLLYKEMDTIKIYCKNVTSVDLLTGAQCKDDPITVVPLGYKGLFRLIDDRDRPMTTVSNIARIMPKKILSSMIVTGYIKDTYTTNSNLVEPLYQKVEIQPCVFKVLNIREDFVRYTDNKKVVKRKLFRCLVCKTDDETEVLLPFDTEGIFHMIQIKKSTSKHVKTDNLSYVYSIKDMYKAGLTRGVVLKLMHGKPPTKPCGFTQMLKVCDLIRDHTVIACTVSDNKRLLELPVAPVPLFVKALNQVHYTRHQTYIDALKYLDKFGEGYANELKVRRSYSISPSPGKEVIKSKEEEKL